MKHFKRIVSTASLIAALSSASLLAGGPTARIDIDGSASEIEFQPVSLPEGSSTYDATGWRGDAGKCFRAASIPSQRDGWERSELTFKPSASGEAVLVFRGDFKPKAEGSKELAMAWCRYANIEAKGAKIENGDFSKSSAGAPDAWTLESGASVSSDPALCRDGKGFCLRVWHNAPASQRIMVESGKPVTISFWHICE